MRSVQVLMLNQIRVLVGEKPVHLTPFQSALTVIVFANEGVARAAIAALLWNSPFDSRARHRLRQLISETQKRAGTKLFRTERDVVAPVSWGASDISDLKAALLGAQLARAAHLLRSGPLAPSLHGLPEQFQDWRAETWREWEASIESSARAAWQLHANSGDWDGARDAAEAMVCLNATDPKWAARLVEARGRSGHLRAAEVAYAQYCGALNRSEEPDPSVTDVIEAVRALPQSQRSDGRRAPPFVGRRGALEAIVPVFRGVRDHRPGFAVITGEAGIGKTRLLHELIKSAHLDGLRCLHARCVEFERVIALSPLIDALQGVDLKAHLAALGDPWRTVVGKLVSPGDLSPYSGDLPVDYEENLPRKLFDALTLLLNSIAAEAPTVLFLDDLHWADSTTLSTLQFFRRRSGKVSFAIVAAIRPEAVGADDPCRSLLTSGNEFISHQVHLGHLAEAEARSLAQGVLGKTASDEAVEAVLSTAGFHPMYLIEVARAQMGDKKTGAYANRSEGTVPASLTEILSQKASRLTDEARGVYALLAIGSGRMSLGDLATLTGNPVDRVVVTADELQAAGLVEGERDRIWVAHDLFRHAIYAELSPARRAVLHHQMATLLRDRDPPPADQLATHFDRAGYVEEASAYGWISGNQCLARGAAAEAAHFYELTARNETDPERVAEATARQGLAHHLGRNMLRAAPVLELASVKLRTVGKNHGARLLELRRIDALAESGQVTTVDLVNRLRLIKEEALSAEDWEVAALALDAQLKAALLREELYQISDIAQELELLRTHATGYAQVAINNALSVALTPASPEHAEQAARRAAKHTRPGDWSRFVAMNRLLMVLVRRGRLLCSDGPMLLAEAEAMAQASGDLQQRFAFYANRALGHMDAGFLDLAEEGFEQSSRLIGTAEMTFARANLACNQGTLAILQGRIDVAAGHFERARELHGPKVPQYVSDAVNAGLGICALERGSIAEARRREAQLRSEPSVWYYDPSLTAEFRARLLARTGRYREAIELLGQSALMMEGQFIPAWLKLTLSQARLMARVQHPGLPALASKGRRVASECCMALRAREFDQLVPKES